MAFKTITLADALADRKSIYALTNTSPIPDERIVEVVTHCLKHAPGPFNVQSACIIALLGKEHEKLWDLAAEVYEVRKLSANQTLPCSVSHSIFASWEWDLVLTYINV